MTKTRTNDVPENLWRNEVFHDRGTRIIIVRPEITLHLEAGYIFAGCSR